MMIIEPKAVHDFYNGVMEGKPVMKSRKLLKDILTAYENPDKGEDPMRLKIKFSREA